VSFAVRIVNMRIWILPCRDILL